MYLKFPNCVFKRQSPYLENPLISTSITFRLPSHLTTIARGGGGGGGCCLSVILLNLIKSGTIYIDAIIIEASPIDMAKV